MGRTTLSLSFFVEQFVDGICAHCDEGDVNPEKEVEESYFEQLLDPAHSSLCLYYDSLWADVEVIGIAMHIPPPFRHNLDQYILKAVFTNSNAKYRVPQKTFALNFLRGENRNAAEIKMQPLFGSASQLCYDLPPKKIKAKFFWYTP